MKSLIAACFALLCLHAHGAAAQAVQTIATHGLWKTECTYNQIMKRRECQATLEFDRPGTQFLAGKIFVDLLKKEITVFAASNPTAFKLAVDKNTATAGKCGVGCTIGGAGGQAIYRQMLKGKSVTFSIANEDGPLETTRSLDGFAECVAAAGR